MKYLFVIFSILIASTSYSSISSQTPQTDSLSDEEIESHLIGKWFISPKDHNYEYVYATSTYSEDHILNFISYSDKNCSDINIQAVGRWKIKNKRLIITIEQSIPLGFFVNGEKIIDQVLSIDSKDKILKSTDGTKKQYRTKTNTCR